MDKILFLAFFSIFSAQATRVVPDMETSLGTISPKIVFVAEADGKLFFAESNPGRSWTEAKSYCASMDLQLASIESEDQLLALKNARNESTFFGSYWTSGRDAQINRQFSWDDSKSQPDSYLKIGTSFQQHPLTCLWYDTTGVLFSRKCDDNMPGTLCQYHISKKQ